MYEGQKLVDMIADDLEFVAGINLDMLGQVTVTLYKVNDLVIKLDKSVPKNPADQRKHAYTDTKHGKAYTEYHYQK